MSQEGATQHHHDPTGGQGHDGQDASVDMHASQMRGGAVMAWEEDEVQPGRITTARRFSLTEGFNAHYDEPDEVIMPISSSRETWREAAQRPGPARRNLFCTLCCIICVVPMTVLGVLLISELPSFSTNSSTGYLLGVLLLLCAALLLFHSCCVLFLAYFSAALTRESHFLPVVCSLCCVPMGWLCTLATFGIICLAATDRCVVPEDSSAVWVGVSFLFVASVPIGLAIICLPRCAILSSRPSRAVYSEWLVVAGTPIGAALLHNEKEQVAALAKILPSAERQRIFRLRMAALRYEALEHHHGLLVEVHRDRIYLDAVEAVMQEETSLQAGIAQVNFDGEEGIDAGGLTKALFSEFSKELLTTRLWREVMAEGNYCLQPEPCAFQIEGYEGATQVEWHYQATGRMVGLALLSGSMMDVGVALFVCKQILGQEVGMAELQLEDHEFAGHLEWLLNNPCEGLIFNSFARVPSSACLALAISEEMAEAQASQELIEGGADIQVCDDNKAEYVKEVVRHKLCTSVQQQLKAFILGLHDIIPEAALQLLTAEELQDEISGGSLNCTIGEARIKVVQDWREHTHYLGAYSLQQQGEEEPSHPVVAWFWELLDTDDPEIRSDIPLDALLRFVTGSSRIPAGGFANLRQNGRPRPFTIDSAADTPDDLPTASTCANLLHIPQYRSKPILREKLAWALAGGNTAFGRA